MVIWNFRGSTSIECSEGSKLKFVTVVCHESVQEIKYTGNTRKKGWKFNPVNTSPLVSLAERATTGRNEEHKGNHFLIG